MVTNLELRSLSLIDLLRRGRLADRARRSDGDSVAGADTSAPDIVGPRDERGTAYPGDFPNDLWRMYRGCF